MDSLLIFVVVVVVVVLIAFMLILNGIGRMYRKVGPNEALIVSGRGPQPKVVVGGGRIVVPLFERAQVL
jgi:flotillin